VHVLPHPEHPNRIQRPCRIPRPSRTRPCRSPRDPLPTHGVPAAAPAIPFPRTHGVPAAAPATPAIPPAKHGVAAAVAPATPFLNSARLWPSLSPSLSSLLSAPTRHGRRSSSLRQIEKSASAMEGIDISIRVRSAKLRNPRPKSRNPPPLWKEIASAAPRLSIGIIARVRCAPTLILSPVLLPCLFPHLCATNQEDARRCLRRGACRWSSGVRPLKPEPPAEEASRSGGAGALAANGDGFSQNGAGGGLAAADQRGALYLFIYCISIKMKKVTYVQNYNRGRYKSSVSPKGEGISSTLIRFDAPS
jgi:hypothetical protein